MHLCRAAGITPADIPDSPNRLTTGAYCREIVSFENPAPQPASRPVTDRRTRRCEIARRSEHLSSCPPSALLRLTAHSSHPTAPPDSCSSLAHSIELTAYSLLHSPHPDLEGRAGEWAVNCLPLVADTRNLLNTAPCHGWPLLLCVNEPACLTAGHHRVTEIPAQTVSATRSLVRWRRQIAHTGLGS